MRSPSSRRTSRSRRPRGSRRRRARGKPSVVRARVSGIRLTLNEVSSDVHDGQRDAVDGDRSLRRRGSASSSAGREISTSSQCSEGARRSTVPVPSTWPWTMWPPSRVVGVTARSRLTWPPGGERPERALGERLVHHVGGERLALTGGDGQADAVDGDRVAQVRVAGDHRAAHGEPDRVALVLQRLHGAELLDDAGEHSVPLLAACADDGCHRDPDVGARSPTPMVVTSSDPQVEGVGDGADAEVAHAFAPAPSSRARRRRPPRRPVPARRKAAASCGPPSRKTCRRSRACSSRAPRGVVGASRTVSAWSSKTRRPGSSVARAHHGAQRLVGARLVVLVAHGELRVVGLDGRRCRRASRRTAPAAGGSRRRAGRELIQRLVPSAAALRPSRLVASFQVTNGRPCSSAKVQARFSARDSRSISPKATSTPGRASAASPPRATGLGSGCAKTTRATPASISAWLHGPVRPVWWHGSSVTTAVVPRRRHPPRPARRPRRAAYRPRGGSPRRPRRRRGRAARSPRAGSAPGVRRGCAASSRARRIARFSAWLNRISRPPVAPATRGDACADTGPDAPRASSHPDFDRRSRSSHLVNRPLAVAGSRTSGRSASSSPVTAGAEFHRPQSTRAFLLVRRVCHTRLCPVCEAAHRASGRSDVTLRSRCVSWCSDPSERNRDRAT